jgi:hypothetical protein
MDQGQHKKPHHIQSVKQQASDKEEAIVRDTQKEMMLVAAARLFRERGFAETTQDEIAAGVGPKAPTLFSFPRQTRNLENMR